jgi:hypothetical protein
MAHWKLRHLFEDTMGQEPRKDTYRDEDSAKF